jgi:RNA polymerase sigma-70 factor, ECF subfamily
MHTSDDLSDEALMQAFCETLSDDVFHKLAQRYHASAVRVATGQLSGDAQVRDVVQETFLRVVRYRRRYDSRKPFAPWFFTILRNACADARRKDLRYRNALSRFADSLALPVEDGAARARAGALLACLNEGEQRSLRLRYFDGLSVEEVARRMGCSIEAAKKRMQRAIGRMRAYAMRCP